MLDSFLSPEVASLAAASVVVIFRRALISVKKRHMFLRGICGRLHLDNLELVVLDFLVVVSVSAVVGRQLFTSSTTSSATADDNAHDLESDATLRTLDLSAGEIKMKTRG